jgi:chromosome segregation protein
VKVTEQSPKELEQLAQEDFVRRCTVAMSVRTVDMLPLKALEEFCSTTSHVYECRQKVEFRLKEVFESGGSMSDYCLSAYEWFQGKYGMNCPAQCDKLQCKATCSWLKEKGQIEARTKELEAMKLEVDSTLSKLKEAKDKAVEANRTAKEKNFTVSQAELWVSRATEDSDDANKKQKAAEAKVANLTKKSDSLKATKVSMQKNITASEDSLDQLKQEIDMGALKHTGMMERVQKLKDTVSGQDATIKGYEEDVALKAKMVETLEGQTSEDEKKLEAVEAEVETQNATVLKWVEAVATAREHVKKAREDEEPQATIDDFEDLEEQQRDRRDKAMDELAALVRKRNEVKQTIAHSGSQATSLLAEIAKLQGKISDTEAKMANTTATLQAKETEASQLEGTVAQQKARAASWQDELEADEDTLGQVSRTIEATAKDLEYYGDKFKKASDAAEKAEGMLDLRKDGLGKAKAELEKSSTALAEADEKESALQAEYDTSKAKLDEGVAENKEALRMLDRRKPEIATEHDLGLLSVLSG